MIEPDSPRRYGLTALQTLGIVVGCIALLYALTAALPGP
jgi:hypothetical protein